MAVSSPLSSRQTVAALLTLTAVTGLVDAVSYLRLGRVFVANMTGNVVFLGFTADPRSGLSAAASIIAIAGFILGALAGGRAAHALAATRPGHWLAIAFAAEAVILGLIAVLAGTSVLPFGGDGRFATITLLAVALGVQNSTVRHLGVPDLTTTVLTLTLTGLAADSALAGGAGAKPYRRLVSVAAMLAGAAAGAGILQWSPTAVIAIAAALVAAVAAAFMTAIPGTARAARSTAPPHETPQAALSLRQPGQIAHPGQAGRRSIIGCTFRRIAPENTPNPGLRPDRGRAPPAANETKRAVTACAPAGALAPRT
jgi:uncharacterized membrane protein YoaK (UPF0700 family)